MLLNYSDIRFVFISLFCFSAQLPGAPPYSQPSQGPPQGRFRIPSTSQHSQPKLPQGGQMRRARAPSTNQSPQNLEFMHTPDAGAAG